MAASDNAMSTSEHSRIVQVWLERLQMKKLDDRAYLLGVFEPGITIYRQQVRALNLVYALAAQKRLSKEMKIAVIGGGFSGITAAAAALAMGCTVELYERAEHLCPLQRGCDTRYVHPHIYDWPLLGSTNPYAELPFLTWTANTAADVTWQVLRQWTKIASTFEQTPSPLRQFFNARIEITKNHIECWGREAGFTGLDTIKRHESDFDAIIIAVGFGAERDIKGLETVSYWKNDALNQTTTVRPRSGPTRILISGTGDGGFIDLCRAKIEGFRQDKIIHEIFSDLSKTLKIKLRELALERRNFSNVDVFQKIEDMNKDLAPVDRKLAARLRRDTLVTLNGTKSNIKNALNNHGASFLNIVLCQRLAHIGAYDYVSGGVESAKKIESRFSVQHQVHPSFSYEEYYDIIAIRHGSESEQSLRELQCFDDDLKGAVSRLSASAEAERLWPPGWWGDNSIKRFPLEGRRETKIGIRDSIEFVAPLTLSHASQFIATLSEIVQRSRTKPEFRVTLHRCVKIRGEEMLQQISPYYGTRLKGVPRRVFPLKNGMIGLAAQTGSIWCASARDPHELVEDQALLSIPRSDPKKDGTHPNKMRDDISSILAIPFISKGSEPRSSIVLYMDSNDPRMFDSKLLKTILQACRGFCALIDRMADHQTGDSLGPPVKIPEREYNGHLVPSRPEGELKAKLDKIHDARTITKFTGPVPRLQRAIYFEVVEAGHDY